jgi:hypothetical protein
MKIAEQKDFDVFRAMLGDDTPGFELKYDKKGVRVWVKIIEGHPVRQIKVRVHVNAASILYAYFMACCCERPRE